MTRWSAFADSTPTWAAVRRLVHPDVLNAPPARPTPGVAAATANAISPTATPARTALATLLFTEDPLLHASPPPAPAGSRSQPRTLSHAPSPPATPVADLYGRPGTVIAAPT